MASWLARWTSAGEVWVRALADLGKLLYSRCVSFHPGMYCIPDQFVCLSQATHHPFYLHVGREIMRDIEKHSKARFVCVMLLVFVCSFVWFRHDHLSVDQFSAEIGKF